MLLAALMSIVFGIIGFISGGLATWGSPYVGIAAIICMVMGQILGALITIVAQLDKIIEETK